MKKSNLPAHLKIFEDIYELKLKKERREMNREKAVYVIFSFFLCLAAILAIGGHNH